ncbi:MAG: hypothetical protein M1820_005206 [Bogoriella megaspora]|nr:MAG: hypothetical protein M1820_005206 [Bogoriella megaspora]
MASVLSPADVQFQQSHIDDDRGPIVTAVSIFLIVVTTLVMVLRFAARKARSLPYGWDDWLAVGGLTDL